MTQNVESVLRSTASPIARRVSESESANASSVSVVPNPLTDPIDLSADARARLTEEGQEALETIQQGLQELQDADISFARLRLAEVQTRLSFEGNIFNSDDVTGRELSNIESQIRNIIGIDFTAGNETLEQLLESVEAARAPTDISA